MRRKRILPAALAAVLAAAIAATLTTGGSTAAPSKSQEFFTKTLLADSKTTSAIETLLRDGGGFVAPEIEFADLTGDERSDAVVLVETGGAAGAVALYVFSTEGNAAESELRAIYRSQRLYRATVEISAGTLILRTPRFSEGDDLCCPAKIVERVYAWNAGEKAMRQRSSMEVAGPTS